MSTLTQFTGQRQIASIVNAHSSGSTQQNIDSTAPGKIYTSSSVTANALQTMLSIADGRGVLNFVAAYVTETSSRTVRIKITIDSVAVFDATSSAITTSGYGIVAVGNFSPGAVPGVTFQPIKFNKSCLVQIASSLGTDSTNITTIINHETDA
jgi:hypothetical protein